MHFYLAASLSITGVAAYLGEKPQMGWNSWNTFKININQELIEETAERLESTGLRDAGYEYLVLDAGWQNLTRAADGRQQANATVFPDGMAAVGDKIHSHGLKYGIYSDAGILDCSFAPGSLGNEELDAFQYAEWGVDYLKYDNCGLYAGGIESAPDRFSAMRDALTNSGREIFYSLCEWGYQFPWFWADQVGQSYRMSGDITAIFADTGKDCSCKTAYCLNTGYAGCSVMTIIRKMREISQFQRPGSFADMDMLEVGVGNFTVEEQKTHFAFWAALKSPLIIGADLSKISNDSLAILKNKDLIAINQDSLGRAVDYLPELSSEKKWQTWAGPLSGNRTVVLVFNEQVTPASNSSTWPIALDQIPGLDSTANYTIQDVWSKQAVSAPGGRLSVDADSYETKVFMIEPAAAASY